MDGGFITSGGDFRFVVGQEIFLGQDMIDEFFDNVDELDRAVILDCFSDKQGRKYCIGTPDGREYIFFSQMIDGCCKPVLN